MMETLRFNIKIGKLVDDDDYADIDNQARNVTENNLGQYFDLFACEITNSIVDLAAKSHMVITINSAFDVATSSTKGSATYTQVNDFVNSLAGRPITVERTDQLGSVITVFDGYIYESPADIQVKSSTQIILTCCTKLAQLMDMSANASWYDSLRKYKNPFSSISGSTVNKADLLAGIFDGTLLSGTTIKFIDGNFKPLPDLLWAVIPPNAAKLQILREILIAYNRIIYQADNGNVIVQPLFIDDMVAPADDINILAGIPSWNVDCKSNYGTWMQVSGINSAAKTINRVDVMFAVDPTVAVYGNDEIDNSGSYIYCSSPKTQISGTTSKIVRVNNSLDYADIYKSSVRLYNSGKWVKPVQRVVSIDNALNDSIMANLLVFDYSYSNVFFSKQKQSNGWAQFYSQLFLAEENTTNYNATVLYDYYAMASLDSPLCQIVSITNYGVIDYPQMLVSSTTLSFDAEKGSLYTINTVPLLSITAAWAKISS